VGWEDVDFDYLFDNSFYSSLSLVKRPSREIFLNAGFRRASPVEFVAMIGDEALHPVTGGGAAEFQEFYS
jgi:hypothetical protein